MFYLPGFDPRDPEVYWGLFRREARLTESRRGAAIVVDDPGRSADGLELAWTVRSRGVATRTILLRWEDIVRARFPQSGWARLRGVPRLLWRLWRSGYAADLRREGRRFSTVIFGVHAIYLALVFLSLALAGSLAVLAPAVLQPWPWLAVPPLAYAVLAGLMRVTRGKPSTSPTSWTTPPSPTPTRPARRPRSPRASTRSRPASRPPRARPTRWLWSGTRRRAFWASRCWTGCSPAIPASARAGRRSRS
ncbi:hypothetical protein ACRBEV_16825 [Methylobacterium phyllosphaerae]